MRSKKGMEVYRITLTLPHARAQLLFRLNSKGRQRKDVSQPCKTALAMLVMAPYAIPTTKTGKPTFVDLPDKFFTTITHAPLI